MAALRNSSSSRPLSSSVRLCAPLPSQMDSSIRLDDECLRRQLVCLWNQRFAEERVHPSRAFYRVHYLLCSFFFLLQVMWFKPAITVKIITFSKVWARETAADVISPMGNLICINAFEENVPFKSFMVMGNKYNPPEPNLCHRH